MTAFYSGSDPECPGQRICKKLFPTLYLMSDFVSLIRNDFNMSDIKKLTEAIIRFRDERDWEQFHNPKDLAIALNIESAELLEHFLWKEADSADREKVKEELADIFNYAILLAEKYSFNVTEIVLEKLSQNSKKYPVEKAKGSAVKYTDL